MQDLLDMVYRNGKCDAVGMLVFLELDYFEATQVFLELDYFEATQVFLKLHYFEATQVFLKLLYIEATLLFPIQRNATSRRKIHAA